MEISFFKSKKVTWKQGIRIQRVCWHSCSQWGWDKILSGERLARYSDYFVLSLCWRNYGVCWHLYPKAMKRGEYNGFRNARKETRSKI